MPMTTIPPASSTPSPSGISTPRPAMLAATVTTPAASAPEQGAYIKLYDTDTPIWYEIESAEVVGANTVITLTEPYRGDADTSGGPVTLSFIVSTKIVHLYEGIICAEVPAP